VLSEQGEAEQKAVRCRVRLSQPSCETIQHTSLVWLQTIRRCTLLVSFYFTAPWMRCGQDSFILSHLRYTVDFDRRITVYGNKKDAARPSGIIKRGNQSPPSSPPPPSTSLFLFFLEKRLQNAP